LLVGAGVSIAGLLAFIWYGAHQISVRYTPLLDAAVSSHLEASTGHLYLEELLGGDRLESIEKVRLHYRRARGYVHAMLAGGAGPGGPLNPLEGEHLRAQAESVREALAALQTATDTRYRKRLSGEPGWATDPAYDAAYQNFVAGSDRLAGSLRQTITETHRAVQRTQAALALVVFLLLAFMGNVFHRFGRATRTHIADLDAARHRAEQGETRYRSLVDNIDLGVTLIDADHRVAMANAAQGRFFGRDPDSFIGKNCFREFENSGEVCSHCPGGRAMETGEKQTVETETVREDGSPLAVYIRAFPVPGEDGSPAGFIEIVEDITEQRATQTQLRLAQFSADRTIDGAFWMSPDGRFFYVNGQAYRSLGYSRDELLSLSVFDISPDMSRDAWTAHWQDLKTRGSFTFETRHQRKDGTSFPVEILVNYLEHDGQEFNCAFARDITQRKQVEADRLNLERQIQQAQKLESLGVLAGGIAHDFNNILMGVLGNAELALLKLPPENPVCENIHSIETAAVRAADLARQMLAYSGKGRFVVEALDINRAVEEMIHLLQTVISKQVVLKFNLAENLPAIAADATQIRQVIMNLITNASEAVEKSSGVVTVSTGVVNADRPSYLAETYLDEDLPVGCYTSIEVADTGCGMDPETREKIFDPFFTTKFTGRGLGLAAVLGIVRGHKGAIKVYSEPGQGTTVKVLFPCTRDAADATTGAAEATPARDDGRGHGTILVVDDDESVRTLAQLGLEEAGFDVLVAGDGREGVRVFQQHADEIRAVVLDMTMPHMGGEETFRELRRIRPEVRVILSSGYNEQSVTNRFVGKGLAGFIQKPYRPSALTAKLRELLSDSETGERA
jgi:PAS domain S-box-containing protein